MATEVTGANTPAEVVTDSAPTQSGEPNAAVETQSQNSSDNKYAELEARIATIQKERDEFKTRAEEALERARIEADRAFHEENVRKGIQRESTQKLQKLAEYEKQLAASELTTLKLSRMERLVEELAKTQLDEDTVRRLEGNIEVERLRMENDRLKQQSQQSVSQPETQQPLPQPQPQNDLPPSQKKQLIEYYFADSSIDPDDPRIDWALNAGSQPEWFRRVGASLRKIEREQQTQKLEELTTKSSEDALTAFREQSNKEIAELKKQLESLVEQKATETRHAEERLNRKNGMDKEDNARPEATNRRKSVMQQLSDIPDEWAKGTPEQRKMYQDKLRELRDQSLKRDWR